MTIALVLLTVSYVTDTGLMHGLIFTKWLWLAVMAIPIGIVTAFNLLFKPAKPDVAHADILVVLLFGWVLVRTLMSGHGTGNLLFYAVPVIIVWLFVRLFITDRRTMIWTLIIYLSIVGIQCILGLLQLYGFAPSLHSMYNITGTFHNPGPYSGFLVSGLPMALGLSMSHLSDFPNGRKEGIKSTILPAYFVHYVKNRTGITLPDSGTLLKYFSQIVIVLILLVLPAARSRAAWLGGLVGSAYILWAFRYDLKTALRISVLSQRFSALQKKFAIGLSILLSVVIIAGLYKLKQGSADGRLLMWRVSWEMIKDKSIMGYGPGGFEANYSNYQAEWFRCGNGTPEQELVAGTPDAPFNEFIRVWVEYGAVGILFIFSTILLIFGFRFKVQGFKFRVQGSEQKKQGTRNFKLKIRNPEHETRNLKPGTVLKGSMLSIIIFSLFSYPLDVAPIVVQFVILSALIVNVKSTNPKTIKQGRLNVRTVERQNGKTIERINDRTTKRSNDRTDKR